MQKIKYRVLFNRKKTLNKEGKALVQIEALLNKRKMYVSTNVYILPHQWDEPHRCIIDHPHSEALNTMIYEFILHIESIEIGLWKRGQIPTLTAIKDHLKTNQTPDISFSKFCKTCIEHSQRATSTKSNLMTTVRLLEQYKPYSWDDLTYLFIKDFNSWLRDNGASINTAGKHLRNLRTLINEAISAGYISCDQNPFRNYKIATERTPHRFLSPKELKRLEEVKVRGKLNHIRDAFLFCCYTGLRYSDFRQLTEEHLLRIDSIVWLKKKMQKTRIEVNIPLSLLFDGKAMNILSKYSSISRFVKIGCNSDTNRYLKELQLKTKISQRITFHVARHTCATLLCHQGVPITTVQKLLGHTKLTTTQIYAELMQETLIHDLKMAQKKRSKNKDQ